MRLYLAFLILGLAANGFADSSEVIDRLDARGADCFAEERGVGLSKVLFECDGKQEYRWICVMNVRCYAGKNGRGFKRSEVAGRKGFGTEMITCPAVENPEKGKAPFDIDFKPRQAVDKLCPPENICADTRFNGVKSKIHKGYTPKQRAPEGAIDRQGAGSTHK